MPDEMKLGHYSKNPVDRLELKSQTNLRTAFKPRGLWFEVEGDQDWKEWATAEEFVDISAQYHYRIIPSLGTKLLHIQSVAELDEFHEEFKSPERLYPGSPDEYIDWVKVSESWDGIIIAPYQWSRRLSSDPCSHWYYGWDCASGCLWNPKSTTAELIREPAKS